MHIDTGLVLAGAIVGVLVGLTGMGGGALLTPILVVFFRMQPLAAVSNDLVVSMFMKPFGAGIHARRKTVHWPTCRLLVLGAVPGAVLGVVLLHSLAKASRIQTVVQVSLGIALLLAAAGMAWRSHLDHKAKPVNNANRVDVPTRTKSTIVMGAAVGMLVGITSVGSGSLMIVGLMFLAPRLSARSLVGTDLVQAVPLVGAAALTHVFYGDVQFPATLSLVLGGVPAVALGATLSSRGTNAWLRPVLTGLLVASAMKLLNVPPAWILASTAIALVIAAALSLSKPLANSNSNPVHIEAAT